LPAMNQPTTAIALRRPTVLADLVPGELVRDVLLVLGAAAFIGALAQVSFHVPGTPVPVTGQTLGVLLAGCALGMRRALLTGLCYAGLGFAGLPWFVGHTSGWQGASTGYIFGFVVAAALCGALAQRGADRTVLRALPTMLLGELAIYVIGVAWLAIDLHVGLRTALDLGFNPFVIGDAAKLVIAGGLLPGAWWLAGNRSR
ncbi:MAG: biotin synthase, partial [Acidimicrobiaceae bacterium]|nr:biotin synthase [Acidimicrobiaceae bacterium]